MIYMSLGMHLEKKKGVTGSWQYVRKRGGGIKVHTEDNMGGGGGGYRNSGGNAYVINGRPLFRYSKALPRYYKY